MRRARRLAAPGGFRRFRRRLAVGRVSNGEVNHGKKSGGMKMFTKTKKVLFIALVMSLFLVLFAGSRTAYAVAIRAGVPEFKMATDTASPTVVGFGLLFLSATSGTSSTIPAISTAIAAAGARHNSIAKINTNFFIARSLSSFYVHSFSTNFRPKAISALLF